MKKIALALIGLLCAGCVWAGSPPGEPTPFKVSSDGYTVENYLGKDGKSAWRLITCSSSGHCDTSVIYKISDLLQTVWVLNDYVSTPRIDADTIDFGAYKVTGLGTGISVSGGNLVTTLGSTIETGEITNQTITKNDIDTTATFVMGDLRIGSSASANNSVGTKFDIGNEKLSVMHPYDQYVLTYDTAKDSAIWKVAPGAAGGTTLTLDSTTAAGGSYTGSNMTIIAGTGIVLSRTGDSTTVSSTGGAAVSTAGDTTDTGKTWRWPDGRFTALNYVDADTIVNGTYFSGPATYMTANGILNDYYRPAITNNIGIACQSGGYIRFYSDTALSGIPFYMYYDTLFGRASTKSAIKNMESIRTDTAVIGGQTIFGDTTIATEGELKDSLVNYVLEANENVQDSGSGGHTHIIYGSGPRTALVVYDQADTTSLYNGDGMTNKKAMKLWGSSVALEGDSGDVWIDGTTKLNMTGSNIDSVGNIDVDTVVTDVGIKMNGATSGTYVIKPPAVAGSAVITLPADGTNGQYLGTNGSGTWSFSTVGATRMPWRKTALDIIWNYPTGEVTGNDTSTHATFPYTPIGTYGAVWLVKFSTSTGTDTTYAPIIAFPIEDSTTVDSMVLWVATSGVADSSKIDAITMGYTPAEDTVTTAIGSEYTTDIAGTTLARYNIPCSRSAVPGDLIKARLKIALKQINSTISIFKAQLYGSVR